MPAHRSLRKRGTMIRVTFPLGLSVVLCAAFASPAPAQQGYVLWSLTASGCTVQTDGQAAASVSAVFGTVSFAAGAYGDIKLTCPVSALPVGQAPNGLTITYYDDNAYDGSNNHCFIYADLLRSNLNNQERGWDIAYVRAANHATSGRQTMTGYLTESMDMQSSYYWVDIQLHRDAPDAACN